MSIIIYKINILKYLILYYSFFVINKQSMLISIIYFNFKDVGISIYILCILVIYYRQGEMNIKIF